MKYIKSFVLIELATMGIHSIAATQEERIEELERIALYEPSDWIDENEVIPTPDDAKKKFNLTDAQLYNDILALANKYTISETNQENRVCRSIAVGWVGYYGTTNALPYLRNIMYNKNDYAQRHSMTIVLHKMKLTNLLIPIANDIVTNKTVFSMGLRGLAYTTLADMCNSEYTNTYINSAQIRSNIATFFLERAALETDEPLYVDRVACDLNPSYRHSQQRRDNLAKLRPIGLTGEQAEIYDGRQRDALPKEEEE
jgi:hypothetical protein